MRVFVTGASGWIGSAVVAELIGAGHEVIGLARSDASAAAMTSAGATPHRATLDDLDSLRAAAAAADGVIHLAFKHEIAFSGNFQGAADADRRAVEAFAEALAGSDRPLVIASGTLGIAPGRVATERDGHGSADASMAAHGPGPLTRRNTAEFVLDLASRGVRSSVHRLDSAHLFRLAVEGAPAGSTLHAVADEGVPIRDIAEVIGRHLNLPPVSVAPEDTAEHFTWLAGFIGADAPASSALTRELLGWQPEQPGLIEDLDKGHYFRTR
jgi:nucleoside-diphosphate-sugar epimerase